MRTRLVAAIGTFVASAAVVVAGSVITSPRLQANDDDHDGDEAKVQIGFEIAPVPLNLQNKNRHKVGLGSYIVNASADCNGCHTSDPTMNTPCPATHTFCIFRQDRLPGRRRSTRRRIWREAATLER